LQQPPAGGQPRIVTGDAPPQSAANGEDADKPKKKKGFFGRIFGVFK
jgi:hypothetical protein